jgi:type II secretory pathway pseudopilin PulG
MKVSRGFTLVEALVGLTLAALAVAVIVVVMAPMLNAQNTVATAAARLDRSIALDGAMRRLLSAAAPIRVAGDDHRVLFEGNAKSVDWIVGSWGRPFAAGLYEVRAVISDNGKTSRVDIMVRPFRADDFAKDGRDWTVDTTFAAPGARLRYAGGATTAWKDEWRGENGWPSIVAFDQDGDGPQPGLLIPLAAPAVES